MMAETGAFSLATALIAGLAVAGVLSTVLAYLCRLPGAHPALRLWTLAYVAYALRQASDLAIISGVAHLQPLAEALFILFSVLLLAGTLRFTGRHVPFGPLALVAGATILWVAFAYVAGLGFFWTALPANLVIGLVMLLASAAFWRQHGIEPGVGHGAVAALFLLIGLHQFDYPFLRPVTWFAPLGFLMTSCAILAIGLALITITQRRQQLAAEAVTARLQRSEAALRESEARFRNMADSMPALLYMTDPYGRFRFVNKTWLDYTGRRLEDELDDGWLAAVEPEDLPIVTEEKSAAFEARQTYTFTFRLKGRDGRTRAFLDRGAPRLGSDGTFLGYVGTLVDVTEQQALAAQLQQAQKMEAIGQLTGGVAHDFNNLLAIILGNLDLLEEDLPGDSRQRVLVRESLKAAERGAELTRRLLAFARRQPLKPEPTDVNRLVVGMTSLLRRTLGGDIRVETVLAPDLGPVLVDSVQLESALLNLAINARDAMPGGGRLTLRTAAVTIAAEGSRSGPPKPGDYVEIVVSDTGAGMSAETVSRAFEPFFTTKRAGHGTGLGLSIVYGFVSQSGGHVSIDSAPGAGTSIRLLLPCAAVQASSAADSSREAPPHCGKGELVLLVEDDAAVRQLARQMLDQLCYRTIEATDGPSALAILAERRDIDLLFTDIVLPQGMNGLEIAQRARASRPDLRVLFMSGYADGALSPATDAGDPIDLLHKPFRKAELALRLRRALERSRPPAAAGRAPIG